MTTRADRKGDGYVLNGRKQWISGGTVSKLHLIFARVFAEDEPKRGSAGSWRVGAGTVALGIATGAYELALHHVKEREQFGRPSQNLYRRGLDRGCE